MSTLDTYSRSYDDLLVHQLMLQDVERVEAYKRSFEENKELFKGKIVLELNKIYKAKQYIISSKNNRRR